MIDQLINSLVYAIFLVILLTILLKLDTTKFKTQLIIYFVCMFSTLVVSQLVFESIIVGVILIIISFILILLLHILNYKDATFFSIIIGLIYLFYLKISNIYFYRILNFEILDFKDLDSLLTVLTIIARIAILFSCLISVKVLYKLIKDKSATLFWISLLSLNLLIPVLIEKGNIFTIESKTYNVLIFVVLIVLVFQYILLIMILKISNSQRRDKMILLNGTLVQKYIQDINVEKNKQNKLNHDYKNHIIGLKYFLDNQEYSNCMKYLDQINGKYLDISSKYNTGNGYLDMIFSSVFSKHQNLNITIVSPIPSTDDIIMIDFATLLYNLLENACDAAELTELKLVKVKIVSTESQYLILVENSSLINPIITDFSTTKASGSHGYGIEIIRDIVKKYKGKIYNDYANFIFITRISIEK